MTVYYRDASNSGTVAGTGISDSSSFNTAIIAAGGYITRAGISDPAPPQLMGIYFNAPANDVVVDGMVSVGNSFNTTLNLVVVGWGIRVEGFSSVTVSSSGTIYAGHGIYAALGGNSIVNGGLIRALSYGITMEDDGNSLFNSGTIESNYIGVFASSNNGCTITNTGTVSSFGPASIVSGNGSDTILNTGLLSGNVDIGNGANTFTNRGVVHGSVNAGNGPDTIENFGTISGIVNLGASLDTFTGDSGADKVEGGTGDDDVTLGSGNDLFVASNLTDGNDMVDGGVGVDTYRASPSFSAVTINLENETAFGTNIGNDTILAFENVEGSNFADNIVGSAGANRLTGNAGADVLNGLAGNDTVLGGSGADTIIGGTGRDYLYGGGADGSLDKFDFNAINESGLTGATRDVIMDFQDGQDRIDVSTIDAKSHVALDQAFTAVVGAFTVAGGQIKVTTVGGDKLVEFNTDNDVAAEFSILVKGLPTLTTADFIL